MKETLRLVLTAIPVLFCGILLVLQFGFVPGMIGTGLLALTGFAALLRKRDALDRLLRLLFLPLLGPSWLGARPPDPGPVFVFLDIELDRRERNAAVAACMASAGVHAARLSGRLTTRGRRAIHLALRHNFDPPPDSEWIDYILERSASLLATVDHRDGERSLDEIVGLCLRLAAGPRARETLSMLLVLVYQSLLIDGTGQIDTERFFERLCRRHGLSPQETAGAKAAGTYYRHAFRNRTEANEDKQKNERSESDKGKHGRTKAKTASRNISKAILNRFNLAPDYDDAALERAWKRILHAHHPDRHHGRSPSERRKAHERFIRMKRDYELLRERLATPASSRAG